MPIPRRRDVPNELILRDAFQGFTRFDKFQKSLGIAPNILSRRLAHLTDVGMFERRRYSEDINRLFLGDRGNSLPDQVGVA